MKRILPLLILGLLAAGCILPQRSPAPENPFSVPITALPPGVTPPAAETALPAPSPTIAPTPIPAARIAGGDHALFNGDWDAALDAYQTALETSAEADIRAAALLGIARVQYNRGQYAVALDTLRTLSDTYPEDSRRAEACFHLARTYAALERYPEAAETYARCADLMPEIAAYLHAWRGEALMAAEDYPQAVAAYQAALRFERAGTREAERLQLAAAYTANAQYTDALTLYDQIYSQTGNDYTKAQTLFLSGSIYRTLGNTDEAFSRYLQAVENYPQSYDSYSALVELVNAGYAVEEAQRGLVDYYAGQEGVALAAFDRYITAPGDLERKALARYYRGLILRERGAYQEAITSWQWILDNTPDSPYLPDAWEQIGYTQWAYLDDYEGAIATFLDFVEKNPADSRAPQFLDDAARVAERSGDLTRAGSLWGDLAAQYPLSPQMPRALLLSGVSYYRVGQFPQAQAAFLKLSNTADAPGDRAAALLWLGKVQQAAGDPQGARTYWEQAAQVDPTGYYSERAGDLLEGRPPFSPPQAYDLSFDRAAERAEAEDWLIRTFGLPPDTDLSGLGDLAADPRWQRGALLWRLGAYEAARSELEALRRAVQDDPAASYRLANALIELGMYRSGIYAARQVLDLAGMDDAATMDAPRYFNRLRFGTYYADLLIPAAQENDFHPLFLFALTRQESLFEGFVRSAAGARGLMQIVPSTGAYIAELLGWPPDYTADDLYRPLVNVRFGAAYLARQREAFDGDLYAALAAYNAGPGNASVWHDLSGGDPDLFVELIRYPETRDYVRGIYEMYAIYYRLYDRSP